jgi:hypothetical protein
VEEGELEVMRTAHLVAGFRAVNLGQQAAEFGWIKRPRCMEAFKRTRNLLADVLAMTISQDYGNSDAILRQIDKAVDDLKVNSPRWELKEDQKRGSCR